MSVIVTIDVLAAVKQALQEPEIRDVIRLIGPPQSGQRSARVFAFVLLIGPSKPNRVSKP
jgi:hypothetical protein